MLVYDHKFHCADVVTMVEANKVSKIHLESISVHIVSTILFRFLTTS